VVFRPKDTTLLGKWLFKILMEYRLGIHGLEVNDTTLLGKWLFKLLIENGVWQTLLKRKYVGLNVYFGSLWTRI
jgi:hypothetical protein